jgi:hypothetical protein
VNRLEVSLEHFKGILARIIERDSTGSTFLTDWSDREMSIFV